MTPVPQIPFIRAIPLLTRLDPLAMPSLTLRNFAFPRFSLGFNGIECCLSILLDDKLSKGSTMPSVLDLILRPSRVENCSADFSPLSAIDGKRLV